MDAAKAKAVEAFEAESGLPIETLIEISRDPWIGLLKGDLMTEEDDPDRYVGPLGPNECMIGQVHLNAWDPALLAKAREGIPEPDRWAFDAYVNEWVINVRLIAREPPYDQAVVRLRDHGKTWLTRGEWEAMHPKKKD